MGPVMLKAEINNSTTTEANYFYGGLLRCAYKFTGKERDSESNLDNFGARYFTSTMGRFMTPDWAARPTAIPYAVFGDPQSLNLYGYVRNDPVSRADADGHCPASQMAIACAGDTHVPGGDYHGGDWDYNDNAPQGQNRPAQNQPDTTAAAATVATAPAAAPTTAEEINAVVKPLVDSAIGAGEKAGSFLVDAGETALGAIAFVFTAGVGHTATEEQDTVHTTPTPENAHKTGERESTREKHEEGQARRSRDRGGEKGDARRRPPRKPPNGWKGPWPPKEGQQWW
jgi:RHS repeat-associated protein